MSQSPTTTPTLLSSSTATRRSPWKLSVGFVQLALVAFVFEVAVAATRSQHAIWSGGFYSVSALLQMLWFWFTVIPLTFGLNHLIEKLPVQSIRWVMRFLLRAIFALAILMHFASWGLYLQTGRFANWETIRFALFNRDMLQEYIVAADRWQIALSALVVVCAFVMYPFVFRTGAFDLSLIHI